MNRHQHHMTFGAKLTIAQLLMTICLFCMGVFAIFTVVSLRGDLDEAANGAAMKAIEVSQLNSDVIATGSAEQALVLGALTNDGAMVSSSRQQTEESMSRARRIVESLRTKIADDGAKARFERVAAAVDELGRFSSQMSSYINEQKFDEATRLQTGTFGPLMKKATQESAELVAHERQQLAAITSLAASKTTVMLWVAVLLCLTGIAMAAWTFITLHGGNRDLRRITTEIGEGAKQVASAAVQVSAASQSMAQGSSEQAASLEETSASTEEINSMTHKNAENAHEAANEVENAGRLLKETNTKLGDMIASMHEINTSSEKISKIIRVIDEIAFQTNILALNAAVEAARAGEAGMGFAVVADEVRNLAQRSAQAAKDTSQLIEESIVRSNEGKTKLDEVVTWVARVVENAGRVSILANEVRTGSQEQARGIDQIARAVAQMQQVTQSTAASAEESASAGEEMSAQAAQLNDAVSRLSDLVGKDDGSDRITERLEGTVSKLSSVASSMRTSLGPKTSAPVSGALVKAAKPTAIATRTAATPRPAAVTTVATRAAKEAFPMDDDFKDF